MKFLGYLKWWEKLLYGFGALVALFILWGAVFKGVFGAGGAVLIYTILQTSITLQYLAFKRMSNAQLNDQMKKKIQSYERMKTLWGGLSLKASAIWWVISLIFNFLIAPWILHRV